MDIQAWLEDFGEVHNRYIQECSRYEAMKAAIESPRTTALDGMPHSGGNPVDSLGNALARLETLWNRIEELGVLEQRLYDERNEAIDKISGRKSWLMQMILRLRYLDLMQWDELVCQVFEIELDDLSFDAKKRLAQEYHKRGREALRKILEN